MPSSVRTALISPEAFFERRAGRLNGVRAGGLALVTTLAVTAVLGVTLRLFTAQLTGTATVDNPARTVEIGSLVWNRATEALPVVFVGLLLVWLGLAVALFLGAKLAGGSGAFGATTEVAAWGLVPTVVGGAVGGAVFLAFATGADLSASSPEGLLDQVQTLTAGLSGLVLLGVQVGTAAWQAYIWAAGLRVTHRLGTFAAVAVAVITATVPILLS